MDKLPAPGASWGYKFEYVCAIVIKHQFNERDTSSGHDFVGIQRYENVKRSEDPYF